ncbi:MAG: redoxin domain-containing protein [bacterium]|nr:redoxin domain-containing protein [bacterium]
MKKLLLSLGVIATTCFAGNAQIQNYSVGQTVNDFTVTDVHGATHNLSQIAASGQWILIDFFFTTCPPCQGTVPYFSELHEKYGCNEGDLFCISIDTGDDDADVLAFENTYATQGGFSPAPAASGTEGGGNAVIADFGPSAYPTYCLIDPNMVMQNGDIWPINNVGSFETAFANAGFSPQEMSCGSLSVENAELALNDAVLFPNPSTTATTLSVSLESAMDVEVTVLNMLGAQVSTNTFTGAEGTNKYEIATDGLAVGQYIVSVSLGDYATHQLNLSVVK